MGELSRESGTHRARRGAPAFLGPVWLADGEPLLVAQLGGRGSPRERGRQANRLVVDDFGNAVAYQRRCTDCRRWLPARVEVFAAKGNPSPGVRVPLQPRCIRCLKVSHQLRKRRDPEAARAASRAGYARRARDPEWYERMRAYQERWRREQLERRPDVIRARNRDVARRYRERLKQDPARLEVAQRKWREANRMRYRLRREQQGAQLAEIVSVATTHTVDVEDTIALPAAALVAAIDHAATREALKDAGGNIGGQLTVICARAGIHERIVYGWRVGSKRLTIDHADRMLLALDVMWWDVWTEDTVRRPVLRVTTMAPRAKKLRGGRVAVYWERGVRVYGDAGADRDALRMVERVWTGEPLEAAA